MLSHSTIAIVKASGPALSERAEDVTQVFYQRLFEAHPALRSVFNPANQVGGLQQRALAGAIVAYAMNIDALENLGDAVEVIAQKHAALGVRPEHYPIVGEHLLGAIKTVLGDAATPVLLAAWGEAYHLLAGIFIQREESIYQSHDATNGGRGFRPFVVARRVHESDEIISLHLEPANGNPIGQHAPGQYVTIRVPGPNGFTTMRHYSLSNSPRSSHRRISVKRERGGRPSQPDGHVSNYLHDVASVSTMLEVGPPCGEFVFDAGADTGRPVVFISGGVGITPVLSMLHAAVDAQIDRDIYFVHAARSRRVHAFAAEVRELAARHPRVQTHICHEMADAGCREGRDFDTLGRVDAALLRRLVPGPDADFYFCGPPAFMKATLSILRDWEVADERIRYEFFGPKQAMNAPIATPVGV